MLISLYVFRVFVGFDVRRSRCHAHTHLRPTSAVDEDAAEKRERSGSTKIRVGNLRHGDPQAASSDTTENAAPAVVDSSRSPAEAEETYLRPDRNNFKTTNRALTHNRLQLPPPTASSSVRLARSTDVESPQSETVGTKPGGAVQDGFAIESSAVMLAKPGITRYEA